jgi:hypothetical protein
MGQHPNDNVLQIYGCILIGNLIAHPNLRKRIVDREGLQVVVKTMQNHQQDVALQSYGCWVFYNLLIKESSFSKASADSGCIELVILAMNQHPHHVKTQMYGCNFLGLLSFAHDAYRNMIIQAKGVTPIGEALRIHNGDEQVKLAARLALAAVIG